MVPSHSVLTLSAGMPRSGSTLIYNLLRLTIAELIGPKHTFSYGWIEDMQSTPAAGYTLLKIHDFDSQLCSEASLIVYSYRDVRDVVASMQRKFGAQPSLTLANSYLEQYQKWSEVAHFSVRYESLDNSLMRNLISEVADHFQAGPVDADMIITELAQLSKRIPNQGQRYDSVTLYHPQHITAGEHGSWVEQLETKLVNAIEAKHYQWLEDHGYPLTDRS